MMHPVSRRIEIRVAGSTKTTPVTFSGRAITVVV
jgi:hypothetical protein